MKRDDYEFSRAAGSLGIPTARPAREGADLAWAERIVVKKALGRNVNYLPLKLAREALGPEREQQALEAVGISTVEPR